MKRICMLVAHQNWSQMVKNGQFSHRKGIAYTPPGDTVDSSVAYVMGTITDDIKELA